jgi:STE24 endopeptidase
LGNLLKVTNYSTIKLFLLIQFSIRQHRKLNEKERPEAVQSIVSAEEFEKTRVYGIDKSYFRFVKDIYGLVQAYIFFQYDIYPLFWNLSGDILSKYFGLDSSYEVNYTIIIFFFLLICLF